MVCGLSPWCERLYPAGGRGILYRGGGFQGFVSWSVNCKACYIAVDSRHIQQKFHHLWEEN